MKPQSVVLQSRFAKKRNAREIYFSLFSLCFISSQSHSGHLEPGHLLKTPQTPPAPFSLALAARHIASWPRSRRPSMCPSVTACLFIQLELFFLDTPQPPAVGVCLPESETSAHPPPPLFFSIIFGTHNHPGENPGLSQSSNTGCFGPAPSPLRFTVQIPFSVCVSVYLLHANPVWSVLLFIAGFFFLIFSGDSLSACAWLPLPHLERHFMQLGHPILSFPLLPVGRW